MQAYISILRSLQIPHHSVSLSYDEITKRKVCIPPSGWQKITFSKSIFNPRQNAIIQIAGRDAGIIIIDVDGTDHPTNKIIINLCLTSCKFYNRTRKGYHFFFKYSSLMEHSHNIKYADDTTNSGLDILSNGKCAYYGSYKIGNQIITYDNILHDAIIEIPTILLKELEAIITKSGKSITNQRKTKKYPNIITRMQYPEHVSIDISTLDQLIACFPKSAFTIYDQWIKMAFIIKQSNHSAAALALFHKYSISIHQYANVSIDECARHWNTIPYCPDYVFQETLYLARRSNSKLFSSIKLPWFNISTPLYIPLTFNNRFLEYETLLPHFRNNKILAIHSPYGTGKTQFLSKLFTDPTIGAKRILFITARVSLSYSTLQSFPDFQHYQSIQNRCEFTNINKLIIQLDSIHKLTKTHQPQHTTLSLGTNNDAIFRNLFPNINTNSNSIHTTKQTSTPEPFDIVALDEIESLLYHLSFNKLPTNHIFSILTEICNNAHKIIALDGDFSNRSYSFLRGLNSISSSTCILENQYQPPPKHFIFTNDHAAFDNQIDKDLTDGLNIVIICMTLKSSEHYYHKYKDSYSCVIHNSIQNDKKGLENINNYWKVRLLIYTSTIESGCDFNEPWFHKCHIILSNCGTTSRALMQMTHRCRLFSNNNVCIYTNGIPFNEFATPYLYDEICMKMSSLINKSVCDFNLLDKILTYNECETLNKQYFISVLCELLRRKGHTYEYRKALKTTKKKFTNNILPDIASADCIHEKADYDGIVKLIRIPNTPANIMRSCYCSIKKYLIAKLWNLDIETIILDDVKRYYPKINKLLAYKFFIKYVAQNTTNTTLTNIKLRKRIKYIQDILTLFGIRHQDDFEFSIDCGSSPAGRKQNRKSNPFIITATRYKEITDILLPVIKSGDFRFVFNLGKINGNESISDRQILETIKKVIAEYGFVLDVIRNTIRDAENNSQYKHVNTYLIDLDETLIELFNSQTRSYYDQIQDEELDKFIEVNDDDFEMDFIEEIEDIEPVFEEDNQDDNNEQGQINLDF